MNNLLEILNKSVNYLKKRGIENARLETEKILAEILNVERIMLYANFERELSEEELAKIRSTLNSFVHNQTKESMEESLKEETLKTENLDMKKNNIKTLLDKSVTYLEKNGIEEARLKAEIIFSHVLKTDRMMLFMKYREDIAGEQKELIRKYVQKVGKEKFPVQYLLNEQEFYGRNFYVNKGVLIPRRDTETLVFEGINALREKNVKNPKILDVGVGSGVIGISLALEIEGSKVLGVDISENALEIANKNKEILTCKNIKLMKSNLFENVEYKNFDLIISNPPYIDKKDMDIMSVDTMYEPEEALFAENEGLFYYYEIAEKGYEHLNAGGYLAFEIGYDQGEKVSEILKKFGYTNIRLIKDMQGLDRVLIGEK